MVGVCLKTLWNKIEPTNCDFIAQVHRLCVYASGSVITVTFNCWTLIICSRLHFGQKSGNLYNSVSSLIFIRVLPLQQGHIIHLFFISSNSFIKNCIFSTGLSIISNPHILFAYGIHHKKIAHIKKQETYRKTENRPQKNIVHDNRQ